MAQTFRVKGWEKHQHYKDRNPPWIRFYNTTLDDYEVAHLPDVAKAHLFGIWLLASRYENVIPYDANWIGKKINATAPVDLEQLASLGLIEIIGARTKTLARRKQVDVPETEANTEAEKKEPPKSPKGEKYPEKFLELRKAYPSRGKAADPNKLAFGAWEKALKNGANPDELIRLAPTSAPPEKHGTEFVPQLATWLNQERFNDKAVAANITPFINPEESQWEARCSTWKPGKFWNRDQWGPAPNEPGCKAPKRFLAEKPFDPVAEMPAFMRRPNNTMAG